MPKTKRDTQFYIPFLIIIIICITINLITRFDRAIMYVCLCKGITDSQIKNAVDDGATSLRALRKELGAMTQCGKCATLTKEILKDQLALNRAINFDMFYSAV